jgi:5-methyltetrahydrofolate--homocysteine methyltransferase
MSEDILGQIRHCLIMGKMDREDEGFDGDLEGKPGVKELVQQAVDRDVPAARILTEALNTGMEEVGQRYESGEYLIPDMLASAECIGEALTILEPLLVQEDVASKGKFVIATVQDDLHDIGKNIVATLLKGSGFEVIDLGASVPAEKIVETVKESEAQFVGLSALLTTTMENMHTVIEQLTEAGLRQQVKVLVGGAPVSAEFAERIGADLYCEDAFDAIDKLDSAT